MRIRMRLISLHINYSNKKALVQMGRLYAIHCVLKSVTDDKKRVHFYWVGRFFNQTLTGSFYMEFARYFLFFQYLLFDVNPVFHVKLKI